MGISSKILKAINHKPDRVMEHYEIRKQSISDLTINNHKHA